MILLITSFLAGALSVLAPCVVSIIPLLIGRSVTGDRRRSPVFVIGGLATSITLFSILLKSTTLLIAVPAAFWSGVSGAIILSFGLFMIWPHWWEQVSLWLRLPIIAQRNLSRSSDRRGVWADILLGASLGPVFSACSPTYALIVATILPADPLHGLIYLLAYVAGLSTLLAPIVLLGRRLIAKLEWGIRPGSLFNRLLGVLLVLIGLAIVTGFDKTLLGLLVENGWFDWQINLESGLASD